MRLALFLFCLLCMAGSASAQINLVVCADPNQPPGDQNPPTRCPLLGNLVCPTAICSVGANGGCAVGFPTFNYTMDRTDQNSPVYTTTPVAGSPGKGVTKTAEWECYRTRECKCVPTEGGALICLPGQPTIYTYASFKIIDIGCVGPDY
jgi:hypothetical protein